MKEGLGEAVFEAPPPDNETARLATLAGLNILDTPTEPRFDRITRFAAQLFEAPICLISLIDAQRQWFKSRHGLDITETPRAFSFCAHAILSHDVTVVPDTLRDERFADNPYVIGAPFIRFYAGCPLTALDGSRLGTLCIADYRPRRLNKDEAQSLRDIALWVQYEINGTRPAPAYLLLQESQSHMDALLDNTDDLIQYITLNGHFIYVNRAWRNALGYNNGDLAQLTVFDVIPAAQRESFETALQRVLAGETSPIPDTPFIAKDGRRLVLAGRATRRCKDGQPCGVSMVLCDITEQREAEGALQQAHGEIAEHLRMEHALRAAERALKEQEQQYRLLFENNPQPMYVYDHETLVFLAINDAAIAQYGYTRDEFLVMTIKDIHPAEDAADLLAYLDIMDNQGSAGVWRHRRKDGSLIDVEILYHELPFAGRPARFIMANDVTERRKAQEKLWRSEKRYRDLVESSHDLIWSVDAEGRWTFVNQAARRILGYEPEEMLGRHFTDMETPEQAVKDVEVFKRILGGQTLFGYETVQLRKDGSPVTLLYNAIVLSDEQGNILGATGTAMDISERKKMESALVEQALHDPLTGLPNRALLYNTLQQAISAGRRDGKPFALLLMDLNRFKEVNDTLGHQKGDLLLRQIGPRLRRALRDSDTIARLGGDEFAVVLPRVGADEVVLVAQKILNALQEPIIIEGLSLEVGASIGIALYPEHGADADLLVQRADVAMYAAKEGNGGYALYEAQHDHHNAHRLALIGELRHAVEHEQLLLYYQPKVAIGDGRVAGVEALVRWQHPRHGLIAPDQFIPIAERTGLINRLTLWVLGAALRQGRAWHRMGLPVNIAVNLSAHNLQNQQFADQVAQLLHDTDFVARHLELEITESVIMTDPVRVTETLGRLSGLGVRLSIDDFGIGYSSLSHLKKLPVDEIKIDQSFIMGMATNEDDRVIVRQIVDLGHALGLKVVGEGVEARAVWDKLAALNCDIAQGYHLSGPLPVAAITDWLAQRRGEIN